MLGLLTSLLRTYYVGSGRRLLFPEMFMCRMYPLDPFLLFLFLLLLLLLFLLCDGSNLPVTVDVCMKAQGGW